MAKGLRFLLGFSVVSIVIQSIWTVLHWLGFGLWKQGLDVESDKGALTPWLDAELWDVTLGPFYQQLCLTTLTLGLLVYGMIKYKNNASSQVAHVVLLLLLTWVFWTFFKGAPSLYVEKNSLVQYFIAKNYNGGDVMRPLFNIRISLIVLQLFLILSITLTKDNK